MKLDELLAYGEAKATTPRPSAKGPVQLPELFKNGRDITGGMPIPVSATLSRMSAFSRWAWMTRDRSLIGKAGRVGHKIDQNLTDSRSVGIRPGGACPRPGRSGQGPCRESATPPPRSLGDDLVDF